MPAFPVVPKDYASAPDGERCDFMLPIGLTFRCRLPRGHEGLHEFDVRELDEQLDLLFRGVTDA